MAWVGLGIILMAISGGGQATLAAAVWAEFYGTRHIGAVKSLATSIMVFGSAVGPGFTGILMDLGIGLEQQFIWYGASFVLASAGMIPALTSSARRLGVPAEVDVKRT